METESKPQNTRPERRGILRYAAALYRLLTSSKYRQDLMRRLRKPRNQFQIFNYTLENRYPKIFQRVKEIIGNGDDVRLLSFGCSTGEEVFSLRKYFPNATIRGLDIDPQNIATCRERLAKNPDSKISFEVANSVRYEPVVVYDAIFCMAVFRHGRLVDGKFTRCDRLIRFADFRRSIAEIAKRLKPAGLLAITHANFRFRDTPTAVEFDLVLQMDLTHRSPTPVFDTENRRTDEVNYGEVLFQKKTANSASR